MNIKSILVIGGTGMLGEPVARRLAKDGYRVRVFTHTPEKARAKFGTEFEIVAGDVEDPASLEKAMQGCWGVHVNSYGGPDPDLERRGVQNIARAAVKAGLQRLTYISGATVQEANTWYAGTRAKFEAEKAIRESGLPYTIFRAASFMETLPQYVRGKQANLIGKQPFPRFWVAAEDYARMVSTAYADPKAANKTLYILGPQALTIREALQTYCGIVSPEAKVSAMPLWMAPIVARLFGVKELANALPYIRYSETVGESGNPTEANALLGAPKITLEQWSRSQAAKVEPPLRELKPAVQGDGSTSAV